MLKPVKRVEIVIDAVHLSLVLQTLERCGLKGYSVLQHVTGKGDRGVRDGGELTGVLENRYVLTTCPPEDVQRLGQALRPILRAHGGICLVSDGQWLEH
jgi:nitrogen regulatory protein PII